MGKAAGITKEDILAHVTKWLEALPGDAKLEFEWSAGTETREDWTTSMYRHKHNGTATVTITVNGGARDTSGPPITNKADLAAFVAGE
jgi:hypothetical protein